MPKRADFKERTERQAAEGKIAMAEYLSEAERSKKRTAELREARLAKEAELPLEKVSEKKPGGKMRKNAGFHCPHCSASYHVRTETITFDPENNTAKCEDCGGVMAIWHYGVRPLFSKRLKKPPRRRA